MNDAAIELCLADVGLLDRRGELLQKARKKVADDGYVFKKGQSFMEYMTLELHQRGLSVTIK